MYVSLVDAKKDYKWVVYTMREDGGAVGLADGFAPCDGDGFAQMKQEREARFPFGLVQMALDIKLEKADASVKSDKVHILNKMIGEPNLNTVLPETHTKYDELNETLRARFAAGSARAAVDKGGEHAAAFFAALAKGRMLDLSLDFSDCDKFAGAVEPVSYTHLTLPTKRIV